jgi:membrane-bound serine protease (ClpP class)
VDAAERIADAISDSAVPVYTLVNRRAFSAGALIALSTQRIYMRPGSVIGAATPVDGAGQTAPEKIVSAMRSEMRALAEARGLDPLIAEAMVDPDISVEGVVEAGKLLTLTTEEAVRVGYATAVEDMPALLAQLGQPSAQVETSEANWAERVVRFFSNPVVAPFLLTLGFLGLITEIKTPSFGMAGAAGLLALSLFFGSHLIVGLAGLEDLIVFGVGLALVGVEIFLIPGFGLFGILGALGIVAGLYMSLIGSIPTSADFTRAGMVLSTTVLLIVVTAWVMIRSIPRASRLAKSGVFLLNRTDRSIGYESAPPRRDLVGVVGKAITDLRPSGTGLFGDERIDVVSESEWITEGTPISIISAEGYRHIVRPVSEQSSE